MLDTFILLLRLLFLAPDTIASDQEPTTTEGQEDSEIEIPDSETHALAVMIDVG